MTPVLPPTQTQGAVRNSSEGYLTALHQLDEGSDSSDQAVTEGYELLMLIKKSLALRRLLLLTITDVQPAENLKGFFF